jgi:hypothetical protein
MLGLKTISTKKQAPFLGAASSEIQQDTNSKKVPTVRLENRKFKPFCAYWHLIRDHSKIEKIFINKIE